MGETMINVETEKDITLLIEISRKCDRLRGIIKVRGGEDALKITIRWMAREVGFNMK